MKKIAFALLGLPVLFSCATTKTSDQVISLNKNEITVYLKVGETIKIEAEKNPSTGYDWHLEVPSDCSTTFVKEDTRAIHNDGRIGAPVIGIYEFKGVNVGDCVVEFDYSRTWEGKSDQPKRVKFVVK